MTTDYSVKAATIVDDIINLSAGDLGPEDRNPLRTTIRIAFEVQEYLASQPGNADDLNWIQDTVFSGCDSIHLARRTWANLARIGAVVAPAPGLSTFPTDMNDLGQGLAVALRSTQDHTSPWPERVLAINRIARLQLVFLGATLW